MSNVVAPCRSLSPAAVARTAPARAWSAERYLAALHPVDGRGKISFLARQGDRISAHTCAQDMMAAAAGPLIEQTAYVCMNRFHGPRGGGRRLAALNAVWLDLDVYRAPALDGLSRSLIAAEILRRARVAGLPALSFLVDSGRGFYAIWLLAGAAPAAERRWRAAMGALVEWARDLGADPASTDPARVLRLPESWHDGVGRQVTVLAGDGARHGFDALCDAIWRAAGRPDRKQLDERRRRSPAARSSAKAARGPSAGGLPRVARWRAVRRDLERLRAHWGGAIPDGRRGLWLHLHACALAWIDPWADIPDAVAALAADATPGLAPREARRCAGAVARRAAQAARGRRTAGGLDARYDYGGGHMADLLDVDAGLAQRLGLEQVIPAALRAERRARARQAGRRAVGVLPRALWLAANPLSRERPWRAEGVSRATWYRRQKALRDRRLHAALVALKTGAATLAAVRETGAVPLYEGVAPPGATAPRSTGFNSLKLHQTPTRTPVPSENRPAERSNLAQRAGSTESNPFSIREPAPDRAEETTMPKQVQFDASLLAAAADILAPEDLARLVRIAGILASGGSIAVRDIAARVGAGVGAGGGASARLMPWLRLSPDRLSVVGLATPPARPVQGTLFDLAPERGAAPVPVALTAAPALRKPTIRGAVIAAGVTALTDAGMSDGLARSFLGEMLKLYRLGPVAEAVDAAYARQGQIAEPRAWIRAHISKNYGDAALMRPAAAFPPRGAAQGVAAPARERPLATPEALGISPARAEKIRAKNRLLARPRVGGDGAVQSGTRAPS